jgi:hypothetical protein
VTPDSAAERAERGIGNSAARRVSLALPGVARYNGEMRATFAILILCCASIALADDFKTVDGKEYKNVKVSRVEPDGIVITFSGGIVKLPFSELSPDVQKNYGYDSQAAATYTAEENQKQSALAQQRKANEQQRVEERQKYWSEHPMPEQVPPQSGASSMHGGALDQQPAGSSSAHGSMLDDRPIGPQIFVYGTVQQVFDDGMLIRARKTNTIGTDVIQRGASIFVVGNFQGFYGSDKVQVVGRLAGAYNYTTTDYALRNARMVVQAQVTKLTDFPSGVE